uniref:Helicase ATP-binding domain-containing protein n=1 Tax=Romanomermis culicivorax TaxID=13658 RepID=A0A915JJ69_ROMCU
MIVGNRDLLKNRRKLAMTQRPTEHDEIDQPPGLKIELMPHQKQAIKWLTWRESQQPPGGVLADDMGLGKTLTMIALVLFQRSMDKETQENRCEHFFGDKLRKSQATLVICPASLIYQWQGEIERRIKPGFLNCLVYHGPKRETSASRMASFDFVITSYETVSSEVGSGEDDDKKTKKRKPSCASVLLSIAWERIILDEGHRIKNFKAGISKACCRLPASNRWVLTGTPIHNKLTDFYSLLKFLRFEPFDEFQVWRRWIENKSEQGKRRLDAIIKGILLRRTKDQISSVTGKAIVDLPPKKSEVHQIDLSPLEKKIYDRIFMAS